MCAQRGFKYIGAVRPNRKFTIDGRDQSAQLWTQTIVTSAFARGKVKGKYYKVWSAIGKLSRGHQVKILFNLCIGFQKWHYLIGIDLSLSLQTLLRFYLTRWGVENFYRTAKRNFGWADYQIRNLVAIERHVLLVMLAHTFVEIQRHDTCEQSAGPKTRFTLGDFQRSLRRNVQRVFIRRVFDLANVGFDLDTIYHRLAA